MDPELEQRCKNDFIVLINEEYGYRKWFWFPPMNAAELEAWWSGLESVDPYFMTPESLPGDLYEVRAEEAYARYKQLAASCHRLHLHCDDDSILICPNKTPLVHKGYRGYATTYMPEDAMKHPLDFNALDEIDKRIILEDPICCCHCYQYASGMDDPILYRIGDQRFVEGRCKLCGKSNVEEFFPYLESRLNWRLRWIRSIFGFAHRGSVFRHLDWPHEPYTDFDEVFCQYHNELELLDGYTVKSGYLCHEETDAAETFHTLLLAYTNHVPKDMNTVWQDPNWRDVAASAASLWGVIRRCAEAPEEVALIQTLETEFGKGARHA